MSCPSTIIPSELLAQIPQGPIGPQGPTGPQGIPGDFSGSLGSLTSSSVGQGNLVTNPSGLTNLSGTISLVENPFFYAVSFDLIVGVLGTVSAMQIDLSSLAGLGSIGSNVVSPSYGAASTSDGSATTVETAASYISTGNILDFIFGSALASGSHMLKGTIIIPKTA